MKAPPAPEVFGNYALKDFSEIVYPQDISWLPETLAWKFLAVILILLLGNYLSRKIRKHYHNRYRREGVVRLKAVRNAGNSLELIRELNQVLKLVAMAAYPRAEVASLSGLAWTGFLNRQCTAPAFNTQQEKLLANGSYQQIAMDGESAENLIRASVSWIDSHRGARDV